MKEKLLTKNKSQRMLTGVMVALFFVLSVCTIFTGKYVPTEKGLTLWEPERTQKQDDGTRHIYFTAEHGQGRPEFTCIFYISSVGRSICRWKTDI